MREPVASRSLTRILLQRLPRWLKGVLVAGAVCGTALGIAAGVTVGVYRQRSGSMWPTLQLGDRVFANRLSTTPERGAIVVFRYPEHPEQSFVKRIVGLPGDRVGAGTGDIYINGWKVPRCVVGKASYTEGGASGDSSPKHEGTLFVEYLGTASYLVFVESAPPMSGAGVWTVAEGQYFVLGDNRDNSHDSRMWFGGAGGGVPFENSQGRVRGHEVPELPPTIDGAATLAPALAACLAKRPGETTPPPPK